LGECVEIFDGRGQAYLAKVENLGKDRVELSIQELLPSQPTPALELTLATAVPKGDRFDWLVEKATELGVARLVPLISERSVVDPRTAKLDRLRRAISEAAKQCRRDRLMELEPPVEWSRLVERSDGLRLVAHPGGRPVALALGGSSSSLKATLALGPEGGFTEAEVAASTARGWLCVSLGPTILRVETAAIAGSAALLAIAEAAATLAHPGDSDA
jgi:16S rRNA (uracil1498-N3)-methyltransferase